MNILVISSNAGRLEIAVEHGKTVDVANILENSRSVEAFHVYGMNCKDQQKAFGCGGFKKWESPISQ